MVWVYWLTGTTSLGIGLAAGFFMHRSDFCLVRAFRDLFLFRSAAFFHPLVLLISVGAVLFEAARLLGCLPYYPFPWFGPPSLGNILGGFLFGVGMVLSGGCVVGVLYKLGGGSLLAGVAFAGLLTGSALYAEIHPVWNALSATLRLGAAVTLPQALGISPTLGVLLLVVPGMLWCWSGRRRGAWRQTHLADGFIPRWKTALLLAVLGFASVLVLGMPMGVTTCYAKTAAYVERLFSAEHVGGLTFFSIQTLNHRLPLGGAILSGGAGPLLDVVALIQYPLVTGILGGALVSALRLGEFRPYWRVPPRQAVMVFTGGVIMALGARMASGCNVWHLLGGTPILVLASLLFIVGLVPGAWCGSLLLRRFLTLSRD